MRPGRLSPQLADQIAGFIANGVPPETAAACTKTPRRTFYHWLKRGNDAKREADLKGEAVPESEAVYVQLVDAVYQAKGLAEARFIKVVTEAALDKDAPNLQAAQWFLERAHSEHFGRRDVVKVEQAVERELAAALDKLERGLTAEEYARVLAVLAADEAPAGDADDVARGPREATPLAH